MMSPGPTLRLVAPVTAPVVAGAVQDFVRHAGARDRLRIFHGPTRHQRSGTRRGNVRLGSLILGRCL